MVFAKCFTCGSMGKDAGVKVRMLVEGKKRTWPLLCDVCARRAYRRSDAIQGALRERAGMEQGEFSFGGGV